MGNGLVRKTEKKAVIPPITQIPTYRVEPLNIKGIIPYRRVFRDVAVAVLPFIDNWIAIQNEEVILIGIRCMMRDYVAGQEMSVDIREGIDVNGTRMEQIRLTPEEPMIYIDMHNEQIKDLFIRSYRGEALANTPNTYHTVYYKEV